MRHASGKRSTIALSMGLRSGRVEIRSTFTRRAISKKLDRRWFLFATKNRSRLVAMTHMRVIVDPYEVNRILNEHALEDGSIPINMALIQLESTSSGQPSIMLLIEVDGKMVLAKTTLRLMEAACRAMRIASGIDLDGNPLE